MELDFFYEMLGDKALQGFLLDYKYRDAVKRLANGITHSYNNIFTGLSGQLSMHMRDGEHAVFNSKRKEMIEGLLQRGQEQTSLFFEFCRYAKEHKKICSSLRIARRAVALLNTLSRVHHVDLMYDEQLPDIKVCFNDVVLLLFYLGENAFEAMADGGLVAMEVRNGVSLDGKEGVVFIMTDDGVGFPPNVLERLHVLPKFDSLGHIEGIGLYAVKTILDENLGTLHIDSTPGNGAKVSVFMPAEEIESNDEQADTAMFYPAERKSRGGLNRYMLMVVDDEESMRNILLDQMQRRGHVAFAVGSCQEAVEEFEELSGIISAVLLDVGLQEGSGYECIEPLREIRPDIKIILMSGDMLDDSELNDTRTFFLKKPFTMEMVEKICRS